MFEQIDTFGWLTFLFQIIMLGFYIFIGRLLYLLYKFLKNHINKKQ
jgi:hypothetical protein